MTARTLNRNALRHAYAPAGRERVACTCTLPTSSGNYCPYPVLHKLGLMEVWQTGEEVTVPEQSSAFSSSLYPMSYNLMLQSDTIL